MTRQQREANARRGRLLLAAFLFEVLVFAIIIVGDLLG